MNYKQDFDVIIVGGSYAGLSAAMALGRSLRSVLIIDGGNPCNEQTPHSHNFITQDGSRPSDIAQKARSQVLAYESVKSLNDEVTSVQKTLHGFKVLTASNQFTTLKVLFATGIKDVMPSIQGFSECWGISVIHCPYCHGYEFRNRKTAIMTHGEKAFHLALLVSNLTDDLTILTGGKADFTEEQMGWLNSHNIPILLDEVTEITHQNGQVEYLIFNNGSKVDFKAVYAPVPFIQHTDIPSGMGCELTEQGYIKVDDFQKTSIDGVYACGDNSTMFRSVAHAVARGNIAGAMMNMELIEEQFKNG